MKIALAQINTKVGDFDGIVRRVTREIRRAKQGGASLVAFPEMTTTGYPPRDLVEVPAFIQGNLRALEAIAKESNGIAVVVGSLEPNPALAGKPLFNAAALCWGGSVQARYHKILLPTYDVFDEGRHFEPGSEVGVWEVENQRIGISICEDCWNDKLFLGRRLYRRDPIAEQTNQSIDFFLNISASPFSDGKERIRREMVKAIAQRYQKPFCCVNLVGGNDELVFDGRSLVAGPDGSLWREGKAFQEDLLVVDLERPSPMTESERDSLESIYEALLLGIRDYLKKCGFKKLTLGLSGGIDSALTAVLAVRAVGPKNVLGVLMPSPYSSRGSLEDARGLAKNLGVPTQTIPIHSVYREYRKLFHRASRRPDLADENIQARIRGNLLMALSNRAGALVLSTGNKSELSVGYCTLYGDMSGGLAVISDLPKTMVYQLSRWINRKKKVIPEPVFTKAPSAELRPNQTDQDTLPPYEILDPILKAFIEDQKSESEIVAMGYPRKTVRSVIQRVERNEYKRRQAAPGIRITSKAFGIGRRIPIARQV